MTQTIVELCLYSPTQLPHSRTMETEADTVGMDLLAKVLALLNFRHCYVHWL